MAESLPDSWSQALAPVLARPAARALDGWLEQEEDAGRVIYPPRGQRLRAFELTPLGAVKVVILGQDPYHGPGQANGLAFAVAQGVRHPPSLRNIFTELHADIGPQAAPGGTLEHWASQGVLLLNTVLTVEAGMAGSHRDRGWETITGAAVAAVAERGVPSVFILWGNQAQSATRQVAALAPGGPHCVIATPHPSPLSAHRGFFGSRPFSRANAFLEANGRGAIKW